MESNKVEGRYLELDALRGIAALIVVFFHFTMDIPEAKLGFDLGTTGVDLFFMISGFVIFMSLHKVNRNYDFIVNRFSRLYPTYWTCVTFTFLVMIFYSLWKVKTLELNIIDYLANMTMFQFYMKIPDLDGPYWTMIIEMLFYFGILILFNCKWLKHIQLIGLILCALTIVISILVDEFYLFKMIFCGIPLIPFIPLFFAGILFYKIYTSNEKVFSNYVIVVLCLVCQIALFQYSGRSKMFISQTQYSLMLIIYFGLFFLFVNNSLGFIVSKTTLFFGKISYALYLTHQYLSTTVIIPFLTNELHINFWIAAFLIAFPIAISIASAITYCIAIPTERYLKVKLERYK